MPADETTTDAGAESNSCADAPPSTGVASVTEFRAVVVELGLISAIELESRCPTPPNTCAAFRAL